MHDINNADAECSECKNDIEITAELFLAQY